MNENHLSLSKFVEKLQSEGRYTFDLKLIRTSLNLTEQNIQTSLLRLKNKKRIFSPHRGFYVIVPIEFLKIGAPPITWYLDDMMASLEPKSSE